MKIFSSVWSEQFDKEKLEVNLKKDVLKSSKPVLYPGRFYVLNHAPKDKKKVSNTRPVVLSLGPSKKDPQLFLCIDLCILPKPVRYKFIEMFYEMFNKQIGKDIEKYWDPKDADKQSFIKELSYDKLIKAPNFKILTLAFKKYNIKEVKEVYSLLYCDVYKVIGNFADTNYYVNDTLANIQKDFIDKSKKIK